MSTIVSVSDFSPFSGISCSETTFSVISIFGIEKIYSSATILFCSNAFSQIFDYISEQKVQAPATTEKVGRNDPCPCGSGKKYKNCCGK